MDIGKSFTYMFEDPNWMMKILIGGIVSMIPIVNFAGLGYGATALKNIAEGSQNPLPEWGNFGDHFMKGLYVFVGVLVYISPIILVYCCMGILTTVLGGVGGSTTSGDAGGALAGIISLLSICMSCLVFVLALAVAVMYPAAYTRFAMTNQLASFWDFRGNFDLIKSNASNYIIAILIAWVASFVAGFGVILCFIGVIFTSFWSQLVSSHVFANFWLQSKGQGTGS
jgi:hypothetical protein